MGIGSSVALYFTTYIMKDAEFLGTISLVSRIPSVLVMAFICAPLVKRIGKRNTVLIGCYVNIIGKALMLVDMQSPMIIIIANVILGIGGGLLGAGKYSNELVTR